MKLNIRYQHLDWWFWLVIGLAISVGLAGWRFGYLTCLVASAANLLYFAVRERSLSSFPVQVRLVWLGMVLPAMLPALEWLFIPLFVGMLLVVLFDRCGIARVLVKMPWNRGVELS